MAHTTKEQLNTYKEKDNQFQPKRTDAADWEEAMKETNGKPERQEKR